MAKELHCVQCKKYMGIIKDGNISKGLKPVCTKCFNLITEAAGSWAQHQRTASKDKKSSNQFDGLFDADGDLFNDIFGRH